jgi:hypothetical protein
MLDNIISSIYLSMDQNELPDANLSCIIVQKCCICMSAGLKRHAMPLNLSYNNSAGDRSISSKNKHEVYSYTLFPMCFIGQKKYIFEENKDNTKQSISTHV